MRFHCIYDVMISPSMWLCPVILDDEYDAAGFKDISSAVKQAPGVCYPVHPDAISKGAVKILGSCEALEEGHAHNRSPSKAVEQNRDVQIDVEDGLS